MKEYDNFLSATGKNTIADVAKIMGIDVRSKDFYRTSLELIKKDIDRFIYLADRYKE